MADKQSPRAGTKKLLLQILSLAGAAAALVLPAAIAVKSVGKTSAMIAFSLIFLNVITGSAGLPFYRIFKPKIVMNFHRAAGLAGFALALLHMFMLLSTVNIYGYNAAWVLGPIGLAMLAVTIPVAILRKKMGSVWRRIHQLNYAVFVAILTKTFIIGSNTRSIFGLQVVFAAFGILAAAGLAYRIKRYLDLRKRREARGAQ